MGLILIGFGAILLGKIIDMLHVSGPQERRMEQIKRDMVNDYWENWAK